jgi:hypothetical protein
VAAQAWFLDSVWWLLAVQPLLQGLCALELGERAEQPVDADAARSLWLAGLWADAAFALAALTAAISVHSLRLTELADPDRIANVETLYPGAVELVGLLWWLAACGRLFQFPFAAVRDIAARLSPRDNTMVWGVALLPVAMRWLPAGRWWWRASEATTELVSGWSVLAALIAAWCALASPRLRVRVAWLLGAQAACAVEPLVRRSTDGVESHVIAQWSVSLCAAAWLFVVFSGCGDANSSSPERSAPAAVQGWLWTTLAVWLAAVELTGVAVWPWVLTDEGPSASLGMEVLRLGVWGLSGAAVVVMAADARTESPLPRWAWGFAVLIVAPPALALSHGGVGVFDRVSETVFGSAGGLLAGVVGMAAGALWRLCSPRWRRGLEPAWRPLAQLGRQRFSMPQVFRHAILQPLLALGRLCSYLERRGPGLAGARRTSPAMTDEDLPPTGMEFYALSLWLAAAAVVATVLWLAR